MNDSIASLLNPGSIAIVGASREPRRIGGVALDHLNHFGFAGEVYPINPKYEELAGRRCYPDIESLPQAPDVAVLAIGAEDVLPTLERCHAKGIRAAIIYASGYAETGEEGRRMQDALTRFARKSGMAIAGPNCMGLANLRTMAITAFATTFRSFLPGEPKGTVSLVTQSGNVCAIAYATGRQMGVSFCHFINTGNEACLEFSQYLEYLAADENTHSVVGYIEGLRDGASFIEAATHLRQAHKPLILLKAGESDKGSSVTQSHTAVLAGNRAIYRAAFAQLGAIQVQHPQQLADLAYLMGFRQRHAGRRVAIATVSGAMGALSADLLSAWELDIPAISAQGQARLLAEVPGIGMVSNPVDMTGQIFNRGGLAYAVLDTLVKESAIGVVFIYATGFLLDVIAKELLEVAHTTDKLIVVATTGEPSSRPELEAAGVAVFPDLARATDALGLYLNWLGGAERAAHWAQLRAKRSRERAARIKPAELEGLDEYQAKELLARYGVPVAPAGVAATPEEAGQIAQRLGFPAVVKVLSPDIAHKTEVDGVRLKLDSVEAVERAAREVLANAREARPDAEIRGVLVTTMDSGVCELIVGVTRDPVFGLSMTVGLGGVFTEVFHDVTHRLLPVDRSMAWEMLEELRGHRLLIGFRGNPRADIEAAAQAIAAVSDAAMALGDAVAELEINPLLVRAEGKGVVAIDALVLPTGRHGDAHE